METVEKTLKIRNAKGLHVRAATMLVQAVNGFEAMVTLEHQGERANAKSVMNLLLLSAAKGSEVVVRATGPDAEAAIEAVAEVFERRFGE